MELEAEQRRFEKQFYAPNSWMSRAVQIRSYLEFVDLFAGDRAPLPCSVQRVALYAAWLARSLSYRFVIYYLLGLNFFQLKVAHLH